MSERWRIEIAPFDEKAAAQVRARWDSIAKPLGSLGLLEDALVRIAGITGDADCPMDKRALLLLCADNGVVKQGVTQCGSEVTAVLAANAAGGKLTVSHMANAAGVDVIAVDMGIIPELEVKGLLNRRIAPGTRDMSEGPAMSRKEAEQAVSHGIELVRDMKESGYCLLLTGEVGIGNTTSSSAVASVLLGLPPERVTGRGAGLTGEGLNRKIHVIGQAINVNRPDPSDPLDVLSKVGGFDIAGLCGVFLGGAIYRVPVMVDGFIASVAALAAARLCPAARQVMLASHCSPEPAAGLVLEDLGLSPLVSAGMRVGEGAGAVAALPLLDMAAAVYRGMPTFEEVEIKQYERLT